MGFHSYVKMYNSKTLWMKVWFKHLIVPCRCKVLWGNTWFGRRRYAVTSGQPQHTVSVSQREAPSQRSFPPGCLLSHSLWGLWYDKSQLSSSSLEDLPRVHRIAGYNPPQLSQPLLGKKDQTLNPAGGAPGSGQTTSSTVERAPRSRAGRAPRGSL